MTEEKKVFQYVQFQSMVSPDFWYKLAEVKLDIEKLDEEKRRIFGVNFDISLFLLRFLRFFFQTFTNFNAKNCILDCDCSAFNR